MTATRGKKFPSRTRFMYTHASTMLTARSDATTTTTSPPRARTGRRERKKKEKKRKRERERLDLRRKRRERRNPRCRDIASRSKSVCTAGSNENQIRRSERVITSMYSDVMKSIFSWRSENSSNFVYTESSRSGTRGVSGVGGDAAVALACASRHVHIVVTLLALSGAGVRVNEIIFPKLEKKIEPLHADATTCERLFYYIDA
uniref:Uncharacterized protein n=1 Tax=Trichogramma kaykai TaxID=54128 RepID=A0ABD2VUG9_9HYME